MDKISPDCCPECGSDNIVGDGGMVDGDHVAQECYCEDCDAEWSLIFVLRYVQKPDGTFLDAKD